MQRFIQVGAITILTIALTSCGSNSPSEVSNSLDSSVPSSVESSTPPEQAEVATDCSSGVCTRTYTDKHNGDTSIYSTGYGQSYDVHTRTYNSDDKTTIKSWDSEGNNYSVDSYCDSTGCHSSDSEGNSCSVLSDGTTRGCD